MEGRTIMGNAIGDNKAREEKVIMPQISEATFGEAIVKIISRRRYKAGYEVRHEIVGSEGNPDVLMKSAYNQSGDYIGNTRDAYRLCVKRGIAPEKANPSHNVCSIGFSERDGKWYGWSHRAIYGFQVGDVVKEGDCTASSGWTEEYLAEHPGEDLALPVGFTATTIADARRMAIAFADSVS